jgi:glycerol-3-phosphate dehydrogenase (NAD(P)+)
MATFAVLGATSWGTTLAWLLHRSGNTVTIITRDREEADRLNEARGLARLPDLKLPEALRFVAPPLPAALDGVVIGVPAQSVRRTIEASGLGRDVPVLSAAKGIEHNSGMLMSEVLRDMGWAEGLVAAVSGPNLAHEIARGLPATAVVASTNGDAAGLWQRSLAGPTFRVYTSEDIVGVEFAGAYKNVIAIAAGAAWGMQFGANTVSSIMTRGLAEMGRLGAALGADPMTFLGLAGVGDLSATCFSPLSRNRRFGEALAQGMDVAEARRTIGEAIEGAATAPVALELAAKHGVELPLCAEVAACVSGEKSVAAAMAGLLSRPLRTEAGSAS